MDIYTGTQMVTKRRAREMISKGVRTAHPSGAMCYVHKGETLVGNWREGWFSVMRYYR